MKSMFLSNESIPRQLIFSCLIIIACWLVSQMVSFLTGILIFGIPISELGTIMDNLNDHRTISFLKYIQAFTSFGMFIAAAWIISNGISTDWSNFLKLDKRPGLIPMLLASIIIIVILPFTNLLTSLNNEVTFPQFLSGLEKFFRGKEDQMQGVLESFLKGQGAGTLLVNLIIIGVIPAVGEELIFRGIVQDRFREWFKNLHLAIIISAFIFSALHIQFFSFLPRFILGIMFGYIFAWSNSIWITILAHFINNALAVVYYHLYYHGLADKSLEVIGTSGNGLIYSFSGLIVGTGILYLIYWHYKRKENQPVTRLASGK
jgi:uncharacterized protein